MYNRVKEGCNIFSSTTRHSRPKSWVKTTLFLKKSPGECHARTCASATGSCDIGIRRIIPPMLVQIENTSGKSSGETAVGLKQELRRSFQLQRQNQTRDAGNILCRLEPFSQSSQPVGVHDHIVVGEGDDLSSRFHNAPIVPRRKPWM